MAMWLHIPLTSGILESSNTLLLPWPMMRKCLQEYDEHDIESNM